MPLEPTLQEPGPASTPASADPIAAMAANFNFGDTPPVVEPAPGVTDPPPVVEPVVEPGKPDPANPDEPVLPIDGVVIDKSKKTPEEKAQFRFTEITTENKTLRETLTKKEEEFAALQLQIQEAEGLRQKLEELERYKNESETEMSVVRLEKTEAYQKEVGQPLAKIADRLQQISTATEIDYNALLDVANEPDEGQRRKMLKDLTSGLDIDRADDFEIRKLIDDAQPLLDKQQTMRANASGALEELKARRESETAAQAAARAQEREKMTDLVAGRITAKLPFFGEMITGVLDEAKKSDVTTQSLDSQAYNTLAGAALPQIAVKYAELEAKYDELLAEVEKRNKANPANLSGGFVAQNPGAQHSDFAQRLREAAGLK